MLNNRCYMQICVCETMYDAKQGNSYVFAYVLGA